MTIFARLVLCTISVYGASPLLGQEPLVPVIDWGGHSDPVQSIEFLDTGSHFVTLGADHTLRTWDSQSGDLLRTSYLPSEWADNPLITISQGSGSIALYGRKRGEDKSVLAYASSPTDTFSDVNQPDDSAIVAMQFVENGKRLVTDSRRGPIQVWNTRDFDQRVEIATDGKLLSATGKGNKIGVATGDNRMQVFNTEGGMEYQCTLASNGDFMQMSESLAVLHLDSNPHIQIVNALTGREKSRLKLPFRVTGPVAISEQRKLVTADPNGQLSVWNSQGLKTHVLGYPVPKLSRIRWENASSISWQATDELAITFNAAELSITKSKTHIVASARHKLFKKSLTIGTADIKLQDEDAVGDGAQSFSVPSASGSISACSLISDQLLAAGTSDGSLYLFSLNAKETKVRKGHSKAIRDLAVSQDERYLATAGDDGTVCIWSLKLGLQDRQAPLLTIAVKKNDWIAYTPEGYFASTPGGDELLRWRQLEVESKLSQALRAGQFEKRLFRPRAIANLLRTGSIDAALEQSNPGEEVSDLRLVRTEKRELLPPRVEWLGTKDLDRTTDKTSISCEIAATTTSNLKISSLSVNVNNRTYQSFPHANKPIVIDVPLLVGSNAITALAELENGVLGESMQLIVERTRAKDIDPVPTQPQPAPIRGKLHVVAVGISEYLSAPHVLKYAAKDAEAISAALLGQKASFYDDVLVEKVLDAQATVKGIKQAFANVGETAKFEDVVVIFISAHGFFENSNYFLAPQTFEADKIFSTCISWADIVLGIQQIKANRVVLWLDTCHAGGVSGVDVIAGNPARLFGAMSRPVIFASSSFDKQSLESDKWKHGAFSKSLLDITSSSKSDTDSNGRLSINELAFWLDIKVQELTDGAQVPVVINGGVPNYNVLKLP